MKNTKELKKEKQCDIHVVKCSNRKKDPNFKHDIFKKKVDLHIKCGYTKELAEWKVLGDYNRLFFKAFGTKPNKKKTDINGYYI